MLFNRTIDRASAEYNGGKWDITLGRQRINWGINTVWTPNDIFNTFNYFDFDYEEERPGSDAARVQYAFTPSSTIELAVSPGKPANQNIGAVMYRFNKWNYDFQGIFRHPPAKSLYSRRRMWPGILRMRGLKAKYLTSHQISRIVLLQ